MTTPAARAEGRLREFALGYPDTREEFPWGERALKVAGKVFVFMHLAERFHVTVKLPSSAELALSLPFCAPTGYGLGRAGWVTATFERGRRPPIELLMQWIDESYRAVAPRRRVAELDAGDAPRQKRRAQRSAVRRKK